MILSHLFLGHGNRKAYIQSLIDFQSIQHTAELNLLSRRQQLADLYNYERHAWQQECLQNVETVEERKNRIRLPNNSTTLLRRGFC